MGRHWIAVAAAALAMAGTGEAAAQAGWYAGATVGESKTSDEERDT